MPRFATVSALLTLLVCVASSGLAQPINDRFNTHLPILVNAGSTGSYTQSNVGATDDVTPSCGQNARNGIWYAISVFPNTINAVTFDTNGSDFDTVLTLYSLSNGQLTEVECDDDDGNSTQSLIEQRNLLGAIPIYLVQVSGYNGATGNVVFNVTPNGTVLPPHGFPWNDLEIPTLLPGFSHPSSNFGTPPSDVDDPPTCVSGNGTNSAWRVFTPSTSGFVTIDTEGSNFDTVLSVRGPNFVNEIGCDDDIAGADNRQSRISNLEVNAGQRYWVRVTGYNNDDEGSIRINLSTITGSPVANEDTASPEVIALDVAYPNPFASRTTLPYFLPEAQQVRVVAYDLLGREVAVLAEGVRTAGQHEAIFDAATLPSGMYVVRLTAGDQVFTQRVTVVR